MVASAAMGEGAGDTGVITRTLIRQTVFFVVGLFLMIFCSRFNLINVKLIFFYLAYIILLILLL